MDLLPPLPLLELGAVATFGINSGKYGERDWEAGKPFSVIYAKILRHSLRFWGGETIDPESGLHHLSHAGFGCLQLVELTRTYGGGESAYDDRPGPSSRNMYGPAIGAKWPPPAPRGWPDGD